MQSKQIKQNVKVGIAPANKVKTNIPLQGQIVKNLSDNLNKKPTNRVTNSMLSPRLVNYSGVTTGSSIKSGSTLGVSKKTKKIIDNDIRSDLGNQRSGSKSGGLDGKQNNKPMMATSEYNIKNRLKAKSPWFATLRDPISTAGVKIPDMVGIDTGTIQCDYNTTLTANANGMIGFKCLSPYSNIVPTVGPVAGQNLRMLTSASTNTNMEWSDTPGGLPGLGLPLPTNQALQDYAQGHRIVSAVILAYTTASTLNNAGEFCGFQKPWGSYELDLPLPQTYADLTVGYGSGIIAVNKEKPLASMFYPINMESRLTGIPFSYCDFVPTDGAQFNQNVPGATVPLWEFGIVGSGLIPDSPVHFRIVINYEFIPTFNVVDILNADPSPVDITEQALVESFIDEMPKAKPISVKVATEPVKALDKPAYDNHSGFGMFFDIIKELAPIATGLVQLLL